MKKLRVMMGLIAASIIASCTPNAPAYAVEPRKFELAHVTRVIDGDTAELAIDVGFDIQYKHSFRLYGIDTPEKKQPGNVEATEALRNLVEDKDVVIQYYKQDKYGRHLADIYVPVDGKVIKVNDLMVEKGLAKPYFGGKKE